MKLIDLENKKILILGLGKEGIDALKFFKKKFPDQIIGGGDEKKISISNSKLLKIKYHFGENYLDSIKNYDVIVKSPGIPISLIKPLISKKQTLTSPTDIFLNNCQGLVVGITGTKGKSTTSSLVYNILKSQKINVFLVGNIGKPALGYLLSDKETKVYIYELSSFQLATVTKSPDIAVFLNIYKDHLDHHRNFQEYLRAKEKIFKFQTKNNFLIYNKYDKVVSKLVSEAKSTRIGFNPDKNNFEIFEIIGKIFQISENKIKKEIKNFKNLAHRKEYIGKKKGILFYNDSAATIPEASILAIKEIENIETLIVGGVNKGFNFEKLSNEISKSEIKNLIYFPETGIKIAEKISKKNKKINLMPAYSMKQAVSIALKKTNKNKACLLSPGASSFNMFKDLKERGNLFKNYVQKA